MQEEFKVNDSLSRAEPRREKVPKDGPGPRGAPECYYTSRVLNSTARYEQYVQKLRASEKELKEKKIRERKETQDILNLNFIVRNQRKSLLRTVKERFDLCFRAYEDDLQIRRAKLITLYTTEEEMHMQKLVQVIYDGREAAWVDKTHRLAHLLAKRQKEYDDEHDSRHIPLSKCIHALPSVYKQRAQDIEKTWRYQVQEKQSRKLADKEIDNMWNAVLMKETEALTARVDYETINSFRRNSEAKEQTDRHLEIRRVERAKQQEKLKQETLQLMAKFETDRLQEEEEKRQCRELHKQRIKDINDMIKDRRETVARQRNKAKVVSDAWDSLANQGLAAVQAEKERRQQQLLAESGAEMKLNMKTNLTSRSLRIMLSDLTSTEFELGEMNLKLAEQTRRFAKQKVDNLPLIQDEYQRREEAAQLKRDQLVELSRKIDRDTGAAIVQQMKERELARKNVYDETIDYRRQVTNQLDRLVKHKELTDGQAKMLFYKDMLGQIEYNKLLKERARREAQEETKKFQMATNEYQELITLSKANYGNDHPFMKQIVRLSKNSNT